MTTAPNIPRWHEHNLVKAVALVAPATRMVVVTASAQRGDDGEWETFTATTPVVGLQATVTSEFTKPKVDADHASVRRYASADALERNGWTHDNDRTDVEPLVVDSEWNAVVPAKHAYDCSNVAYRLVACTWPPRDDAAELAKVIEETKNEAIYKAGESETKHKPARVPNPL